VYKPLPTPYLKRAKTITGRVRSSNPFRALSHESREALDQIMKASVFPKGAVILAEGQASRGVFLLCQGQAKLSISSRIGKILILRIAKPGEILGLDAIVMGKPYEVTVETMQPCRMNWVNRENFLGFLRKHSDACLHVAQHISRDYQYVCDGVRSVGLSHSISERLAKFFLEWSAGGQVTNGVICTKLSLTHEEIAQLMGTSRETITRILSELRKKHIIEIKGSDLIVHNKPALEQLVAA